MAKGTDVNAKNTMGVMLLMLAAKDGQEVEFRKKHGAKE